MSEKLARFRGANLTPEQWSFLADALAPFTPVVHNTTGNITRRMMIGGVVRDQASAFLYCRIQCRLAKCWLLLRTMWIW